MDKNIIWHKQSVNKTDREKFNKHKAVCLWFTGLSSSGKSTLANEVQKHLFSLKINSYILDGDNIRHGLNSDLGFSEEDRKENIRRIGEVAKLFVDAGIIVLAAFISPYRKYRNSVRQKFENSKFIEIYVDCDINICEKRDPKGLYKKARANEIKNFTGISASYEPPLKPELNLYNNNSIDIKNNTQKIIKYLKEKKIISV